jgi:hypothetical protein
VWPILAGEVVHHARSSLEHIVWELIEHEGGTPQLGVTGFPVLWNKSNYKPKFARMIEGINADAYAIIEALQPLRPTYTSDPLYVLNEMWNRDKHRLLNMAVLESYALQVQFHFPDGLRLIVVPIPAGPRPKRTGLYRRKLPWPLAPGVPVDALTSVQPQFMGGPAHGEAPLKVLTELYGFAASVVDKLIATVS